MVKLFVVGFPREMGEIELDQLFSNEAMVKRVTIVRDMQTGISKGYAFVEMLDQTGADMAISIFNGMKIGNRTVSVRLAEKKVIQSPSDGTFQAVYKHIHNPAKREKDTSSKRPRRIM